MKKSYLFCSPYKEQHCEIMADSLARLAANGETELDHSRGATVSSLMAFRSGREICTVTKTSCFWCSLEVFFLMPTN